MPGRRRQPPAPPSAPPEPPQPLPGAGTDLAEAAAAPPRPPAGSSWRRRALPAAHRPAMPRRPPGSSRPPRLRGGEGGGRRARNRPAGARRAPGGFGGGAGPQPGAFRFRAALHGGKAAEPLRCARDGDGAEGPRGRGFGALGLRGAAGAGAVPRLGARCSRVGSLRHKCGEGGGVVLAFSPFLPRTSLWSRVIDTRVWGKRENRLP